MKKSKREKRPNVLLTKSFLQQFYTVTKPNWVLFCERLINEGYTLFLYISKTNSKYITIVNKNKMMKVRYSEHAPNWTTWCKSDVKFAIGEVKKGMFTEREVMNAINWYFI